MPTGRSASPGITPQRTLPCVLLIAHCTLLVNASRGQDSTEKRTYMVKLHSGKAIGGIDVDDLRSALEKEGLPLFTGNALGFFSQDLGIDFTPINLPLFT